jgi:hypothetical protein
VKIEQDPNLSPGAAQEAASYQQRHERGRAARQVVPRGSHAEWEPAPDRPDPVDLLEAQAKDRLPDLVPIRYSRMMASPFAFMREAKGDRLRGLRTRVRYGQGHSPRLPEHSQQVLQAPAQAC